MKRCPQCRQMFSDDISFCLDDGTLVGPVLDQAEEVTVVRSAPSIPESVQPASKSTFPFLACAVLALLGVLTFGAVGLWLAFRNTPSPIGNQPANATPNSNPAIKDQDSINQQKANLQDQQAQLEKEKQRIADERKTLDDQKKTPTIVLPTPPVADQPTARINFHRGSVQETVSGSVFAHRSFVLRTLSGQYLSGNIASRGNCVAFANGSTSTSYITRAGDSSLTLVNNCGGEASFSLTVYIR